MSQGSKWSFVMLAFKGSIFISFVYRIPSNPIELGLRTSFFPYCLHIMYFLMAAFHKKTSYIKLVKGSLPTGLEKHLIAFGKKQTSESNYPSAKGGVPSAHFKLLLLVNKTEHLSSYLKVIPIGWDKGADSWIFSGLTQSLVQCFFVVHLLKRWSNHFVLLQRATAKNNYINPPLQFTLSFFLIKQSVRNHCLATISSVISVKPTLSYESLLFSLANQKILFHSS